MSDKRLYFESNRGQGIGLILYSLNELSGGSKQEILNHIDRHGYYDVKKDDLPPYPNQNESKYRTLLAWARKDGVEKGWIDASTHDFWKLEREGRNVLERSINRFRTGEWKVSHCYLWTPKFKLVIDPSYVCSDEDWQRPLTEYE